MKHHLMVGTWTPPGRIYTVQFDDAALTLAMVKKTDIPEDEPISWMTFSVRWHLVYWAEANGRSTTKKPSTARP